MPDQQYTDAQLSDGTTLRFMGQLQPDEVKQKVTAYRAKQIEHNPPGMPKFAPEMKMSMLGDDPGIAPPRLQQGQFPSPSAVNSFEGSYSSGDTDKGAAMTGAGLGTAAALIGGPSVPGLVKGAVKSLPYIAASEGINLARQHLPLGKYIPPGAELLPFFMGGRGKAAEGEPTIASQAERPVARPEIASPAETPRSQWPPDSPQLGSPAPAPRGYRNAMEEDAFKDNIRHQAESESHAALADEKRRWFGANTPGTPKNILTGVDDRPVKYTPTKLPRAKPQIASPSGQSGDLTPILKKSLEEIRRRKGLGK